MTYLVSLYIFFFNGFFSIIKNNKIVLFSTFIFMILLFGGIYNCADEENYRFHYEYIADNGVSFLMKEIGYQYLQLFFIKLGFSYTAFKTSVAIIGFVLIKKTLLQYTTKYNFVIFLYFIYPFIFDVVQFRNFIATAIFIYSFRYLVESSKIKFTIGLLIAVSIHYVMILFIPFIFLKKYSIKRLVKTAIIIVPILSFLTSTSLIPKLAGIIVGSELMFAFDQYFQRANWGFIFLWFKQLSFILLTYKCYTLLKMDDRINNEWKQFNEIVVKLNIYTIIICFPLVMFDGNFARIFRDVLVLNYIVISQILFLDKRKQFPIIIISILLILIFLIPDILMGDNINTVLLPFFNFNSFFEL